MQINNSILTTEEKICYKLRELYRNYGYACFKMSKFEEYDLYARNKDYLISEGVITFTDTDGRLLALKPDVTLSIVKNTPARFSGVSRLYYHENVYRISEATHRFKELMQVGAECIGDVTNKEVCECAYLSALSLKEISSEAVLVVNNLDILSDLVKDFSSENAAEIIKAMGEKNTAGVLRAAQKAGADKTTAELLSYMATAEGDSETLVKTVKEKSNSPAVNRSAEALLEVANYCAKVEGVKVKIDLSLVGNTNYYNGVIINGFVKGVPSAILCGGQYDKLMEKMGKNSKAVGFAVYLNLLQRIEGGNL